MKAKDAVRAKEKLKSSERARDIEQRANMANIDGLEAEQNIDVAKCTKKYSRLN